MPNISELRKKYPQYSDMSDESFADKFHEKFYSDIPKHEFYEKLGLKASRQEAPQDNRGWLEKEGQWLKENVNDPIHRNIGEPGVNLAAGFGQGIANMFPGAYNLGAKAANLIPGVNVEEKQAFDVVPHGLPKELGELASFFGAGGALGAAGKTPAALQAGRSIAAGAKEATAGIPGMERILEALGSKTGKNVVGGGALGALMVPENQGAGAALGAVGGVAPSLLKGAKSGFESLSSKFTPNKNSTKFLEDLGQGATNKRESSISLGNDIRNAYQPKVEKYQEMVSEPLNALGNERIYEKANPLLSTKIDKSKKLLDQVEDLKISDVASQFKQDPSFSNAHKLQSELGVLIGELKGNLNKGVKELGDIKKIQSIRNGLKDDMESFLSARSPEMANNYREASNLYRDEIVPYLANNKLRNLLRGGQEHVEGLHQIFKNPHDIIKNVNGKQVRNPSSIKKVMQDLPEESYKKILFNQLGGMTRKGDHKGLNRALTSAEQNGYDLYFTPEIKEALKKLDKSGKYFRNAKIGTGAVGLTAAGTGIGGKLLGGH